MCTQWKSTPTDICKDWAWMLNARDSWLYSGFVSGGIGSWGNQAFGVETDITRLRYMRSLRQLQLFWNLLTSTHLLTFKVLQKAKSTWHPNRRRTYSTKLPNQTFSRNFNSIRILQRDIGIYLWLHSADLVTKDLWRAASNGDETIHAGGFQFRSGGFDSNWVANNSVGCLLFLLFVWGVTLLLVCLQC